MSKRKLLLADDSETVQKVVNLTFELEGIEVVTFGDGDSAMAQFSAVAPDVVLADVNMPGLDGYQICQNIKNNEATKNTPVILLVGSFEPFDEEKAMQVGADDYLTKPFQSIRQLVSKVNELLSSKSNNDVDEIHFNDTLKMKEEHFSDTDFGDSAMDDEMIQTSQVGSIPADETAKYVTPNNQQSGDDDSVGKTQPLSAKDWQDIYSSEKNTEESSQTVYELADEPDELLSAVDEKQEAESFISINEQSAGNPDERSFAFADEQTVEETSAEPYESEDYEKHFNENASESDESDFGIQPDDIDHFYREPDYNDEEEPVEISAYSNAAEQKDDEQKDGEQNDSGQNETALQDETGFEIVDHNSFRDVSDAAANNDLLYADTMEMKTESFAAADSETETESANADLPNDSPIETAINNSIGENETESELSQGLSPAPVLDFDELDLLEVSFPENRPTSFISPQTETQPEQAEEPESVEETIEVQNEAETEQVKSQVAEQLSGVNLSAADIDAIADKVLEKLTARLKE